MPSLSTKSRRTLLLLVRPSAFDSISIRSISSEHRFDSDVGQRIGLAGSFTMSIVGDTFVACNYPVLATRALVILLANIAAEVSRLTEATYGPCAVSVVVCIILSLPR